MGTESSSTSLKFPPLRLAELMPLMAIKKPAESPDTSYTSGDESENTPYPSPSMKSSNSKPCNKTKTAEHPACKTNVDPVNTDNNHVENKENNPFSCNRKNMMSDNLKDIASKIDEASEASNCTYPGRSCCDDSCPTMPRQTASEVKKRNVLSVRNIAAFKTSQSATKYTPEFQNKFQQPTKTKSSTPVQKLTIEKPKGTPVLNRLTKANTQVQKLTNEKPKGTPLVNRVKSVTPKVKTSTPVMKQGIRKFTPGSSGCSSKYSQKEHRVRKSPSSDKKSIRCLFPEPARKTAETPAPAPETPSNRSAPNVVATPSYPNTNNSKITLKSLLIKGKRYMLIKKLGSGGSSEVFKVFEVGGECGEYAVKCVNLAVDPNLSQSYINEIRLLRELQSSDRVIQLYAYEYDKANQSLKAVLEVGETDLSSFLKARQATGLPPALILYYWGEMLHAVNHIHQHGIIHADLKPANFLLVCGRLKLIDFGIASAISTDATSVVRPCAAGTFSYISPEALMGGAGRYETGLNNINKEDAPIKISFKSDVWSLGCILYSMVYGFTPFGHITGVYAKIAAIVDPKQVINYPPVEKMSPSIMTAMKWCLTYNAKSRPSVQQLLSIDYCICNNNRT